MRRARTLLWLLALPILAGAATPEKPALKEVLRVSVLRDSGGAQRFTIAKQGLHVFSKHGQRLDEGGLAPDTLTVAGLGTVELVSADSGKPLIADIWLVSRETSAPERYTARTLKIERATLTSGYVITHK